jgi:uncharacterized protein
MLSSPRVAAGGSEAVSTVYVDTSAIARMLLDEPDKPIVEQHLEGFEQRVASRLLQVELRRVGTRAGVLDRADRLLGAISLISLDEEILMAAETVTPSSVATLDAIHLVTALRLHEHGELDAVMTYDRQLATGARAHGIAVISPS